METTSILPQGQHSLTDIIGLRLSGIFPQGKEPSIRTLRDWTKLRRIPHHRPMGDGARSAEMAKAKRWPRNEVAG
jgi:hypothetical protein